jgi:hypothetical protein
MTQITFAAPTPTARLWARIVAYLLWLANSRPPVLGQRHAFYDLKARILREHAVPVGEDIQHFVKECYRCEGTGEVDDYQDGVCPRCRGGIYDQFWVRLVRWDFAGRIFHTPGERRRTRPTEAVTIEGRIEHRGGLGHKPKEAAMWLGLLYDRRLFWSLFTNSGSACGWYWLPLCNLQRAYMVCRRWARAVRGKVCPCGRRHWRASFYCRACCNPDPEMVPF